MNNDNKIMTQKPANYFNSKTNKNFCSKNKYKQTLSTDLDSRNFFSFPFQNYESIKRILLLLRTLFEAPIYL